MVTIILIALLAVGAILGFRQGIITQLGAVAGFVTGIIICRLFGGLFSKMILALLSDPSATEAFTVSAMVNAVLFVAAFVIVAILVKGLRTASHLLMMGPIDRILGALFSIIEWATGISLLLNLWLAINPNGSLLDSSAVDGNPLFDFILNLTPSLLGTLEASVL